MSCAASSHSPMLIDSRILRVVGIAWSCQSPVRTRLRSSSDQVRVVGSGFVLPEMFFLGTALTGRLLTWRIGAGRY